MSVDPLARRPRGRLAPSPTGALHLGNLRSFALAWLSIRSRGGCVVLRIEDLDGPRVKGGAAAALVEDLRWLGFDWEEGPEQGGPFAPYVQTERVALYREVFEDLRARGEVYPCICTRREIESVASAPNGPQDEGPHYPGTCRDRFANAAEAERAAEGRPLAWRYRVPAGEIAWEDGFRGACAHDVAAGSGDFVIWRDGPSYQLAVVVDDHAMEIDEVLRGDDLLTSAARQLWLYRSLGARPPGFAHVPLVVGLDGRRLAKRHGDSRIRAYREAGLTSEQLIGWVGRSCGWSGGEPLTLADLVPRFELAMVPREPCIVDVAAFG